MGRGIIGLPINETTTSVIIDLEYCENVTFNDCQREIIRLIVQDSDKHSIMACPRRSGKSFIVRTIVARFSNDVHVVFPSRNIARYSINDGLCPDNVHYMDSIYTLSHARPAPEIIICEECSATDNILSIPGVHKVLSLYTPPEMAMNEYEESGVISGRVTEDDFWDNVYPCNKKEREWDDETN